MHHRIVKLTINISNGKRQTLYVGLCSSRSITEMRTPQSHNHIWSSVFLHTNHLILDFWFSTIRILLSDAWRLNHFFLCFEIKYINYNSPSHKSSVILTSWNKKKTLMRIILVLLGRETILKTLLCESPQSHTCISPIIHLIPTFEDRSK